MPAAKPHQSALQCKSSNKAIYAEHKFTPFLYFSFLYLSDFYKGSDDVPQSLAQRCAFKNAGCLLPSHISLHCMVGASTEVCQGLDAVQRKKAKGTALCSQDAQICSDPQNTPKAICDLVM